MFFLMSQELEAPKDVKVGYYMDGKRNDIAPARPATQHPPERSLPLA
jgi:hypothetical protein